MKELVKFVKKPILDSDYLACLSDKTFSYMNIDPKVNGYITNKNWSHINDGLLDASEYDVLYGDIENQDESISDFVYSM